MNIFKKNEFWLLIFSIGLIILENYLILQLLMTLVMIVPLLLATMQKIILFYNQFIINNEQIY